MFRFLIALSFIFNALAFAPASKSTSSSVLSAAKSKSVPFMDQPVALTGKLPGDVGFDPLGLSSLYADKDWGAQVVPDNWQEASTRTPIKTIDWMVEAEIKHGRIAMLAVAGWAAVDSGVRFPGSPYGSILNSVSAHTAAVENGSLGVLLLIVSLLEITSGAAIYDQSKGSGRQPGDFSFDPLGLGKNAKTLERFRTNEIKNGRLAMLAFSGIVTAAAAFPDKAFPYL